MISYMNATSLSHTGHTGRTREQAVSTLMQIRVLFRIVFAIALLVTLYFTTTAGEPGLASVINDKVAHALAFLLLTLLADISFPEARFSLRITYGLAAYGMLIECIQFFLPYRSFSLLDFAADLLGIGVYFIFLPLLQRMQCFRRIKFCE